MSTAGGSAGTSSPRQGCGTLFRPPLSARPLGSWTTLATTAAGAAAARAARWTCAAPVPPSGVLSARSNGPLSAGGGYPAAGFALARSSRALRRPRPARLRPGMVHVAMAGPRSRSRRRSGAPTLPAKADWCTRRPARARPTPPGRAGARVAPRLSRAASPQGRGGAAAPRPLDHPAPRAGRRHRGGPSSTHRGLRAPLDRRVAHRRHQRPHPRAPARAPAHGARHHTGEPLAAAHPRRCGQAVRSPRARGRRRVARADRLEARRPDRARASRGFGASVPSSDLGLSATLGNLDTARDALLGIDPSGTPRPGASCRALIPKALRRRCTDPARRWSGFRGRDISARLLPAGGERDRGR